MTPPPLLRFGSDALKDYVFSSDGLSPHLAAYSENQQDEDVSLDCVSDTRQLKIFFGGRKQYLGASDKPAESSSESTSDKASTPDLNAFHSAVGMAPLNATESNPTPVRSTALYLSPSPEQRRTPGRRISSPTRSRTRSPSLGKSPAWNPYVELAWATMRGDHSYYGSVAENARKVIELLTRWPGLTDSRYEDVLGWVYILRDPELDLVKIGYTVKSLHERGKAIRNQCRAGSEWKIVDDAGRVPIAAFKLLEKLVQTDLAPHRWYFDCECGLRNKGRKTPGYTQHQEWFEVTDERSFLLKQPFEQLQFGLVPRLQQQWHVRLIACEDAPSDEEHDNHTKRLGRWKKILGDVQPDVKESSAETKDGKVAIKLEPSLQEEEPLAEIPSVSTSDIPAPSIEVVPSSPLDAALVGIRAGQRPDKSNGVTNGVPEVDDDDQEENAQENAGQENAGQEDVATPRGGPPQRQDNNPSPAPTATRTVPLIINEAGFNLAPLIQKLTHFLKQKRPPIPERTICEDMVVLRWPLACALAFALQSPYAPAALSAALGMVFLPCFVAELRAWY